MDVDINKASSIENVVYVIYEIGDEFHDLFKCHFFTDDRTTFISNRLCRNPNVYTTNRKLLLALGKFFTKVLESVKNPPD